MRPYATSVFGLQLLAYEALSYLQDETGRVLPKKWVRVDTACTLRELVRLEGHVVAEFPVLHVVEQRSAFEKHLLASEPEDFLPPLHFVVD
jgi:hypothetical protein